MKKWLIISGIALVLAGCSEPVTSVMDETGMDETEKVKEQMEQQVHLYSLEQNTEGYVVRWDERDKWILTNASAVYQTSKVLVETSNGQLLEGTVVSMDTKHNIAILHFRNSADVVMKDIKNEQIQIINKVPTGFSSFDGEGKAIEVNGKTLKAFVEKAAKKELAFDKRMEARAILESYPKRNEKEENKVDTYEKDTFRFDRDELEQYTYDFVDQYNLFIDQKDNKLLSLLLPDELKEIFTTWEVFDGTYAFTNPEVTSIQYTNFAYQISFKAVMGEKKPKNVIVSLSIIKMQDEYKITSFDIYTAKN